MLNKSIQLGVMSSRNAEVFPMESSENLNRQKLLLVFVQVFSDKSATPPKRTLNWLHTQSMLVLGTSCHYINASLLTT